MCATFFRIGPFYFQAYHLFLSLALVVGSIIFYWQARKRGFETFKILSFISVVLPISLIGSHLSFVILNLGEYKFTLQEILIFWRGGFTFQGGLISAILVFFLFGLSEKKKMGKWFDAGSFSLLIGHSIGRIGCLLNGCCYGKVSNVPWAVKMCDNLPRHPTQLYEAIGYFLAFLILVILLSKPNFTKLKAGSLACLGLFLHCTIRFIVEYFRHNEKFIHQGANWYSTLSIFQFIALSIMIISLIFFLKINERKAD